MRANPTPAEARLWYHLRARRFEHLKFRQQTVLGHYIIDFTSRTAMLAIEVDGDTHANQQEYDARRTGYLERNGFRVLRFTNYDVMTNIEGVLHAISEALKRPSLRLRGEGKRAQRSEGEGRDANSPMGLISPSPGFANAQPPSPRKRREGAANDFPVRARKGIVTNLVRSPPPWNAST